MGGERGGEKELEVSCGVRELTEWAAQKRTTRMRRWGGKYEASPQTDQAKIQRIARNAEEGTQRNCSARADSLFSPETHSGELLYTGKK